MLTHGSPRVLKFLRPGIEDYAALTLLRGEGENALATAGEAPALRG